ncbi:MAG: hypothetical protein LBS31_10745 [Candidatus Adiutrix sp.]|jgi:hypothetical protein|nr:hypothetical protein [Candidatus Adiutrix sp.]
MSDAQYLEEVRGFAVMSFGDKLNRAMDLVKSRGLSIFLVALAVGGGMLVFMLLGGLIMGLLGLPAFISRGGSAVSAASAILLVLFAFVFYFALIFLGNILTVGVFSLLLRYVHEDSPDNVAAVVLAPLRRLTSIGLPLVAWVVVFFVTLLIVALFSLIPFVGILINLAGSFFLNIWNVCVLFYLADKEEVGVAEILTEPLRIFMGDFLNWLLASAAMFIMIFPGAIVLVLIFYILGSGAGGLVVGGLFGLIYFVLFYLFAGCFTAYVYRQSSARLLAKRAATVF